MNKIQECARAIPDRTIRERCSECEGIIGGEAYLKRLGRYEMLIPSRCPHKDNCEQKILRLLQIEGIPDKRRDGKE